MGDTNWQDDPNIEWIRPDHMYESAYKKFIKTRDSQYIDDLDIYEKHHKSDPRMRRQPKSEKLDKKKNNNN